MTNGAGAILVCLYIVVATIALRNIINAARDQILTRIAATEEKIDRFYAVLGQMEDEVDQIRAYYQEERVR